MLRRCLRAQSGFEYHSGPDESSGHYDIRGTRLLFHEINRFVRRPCLRLSHHIGFHIDFPVIPWHRGTHRILDLVHRRHIVITVELGGLHFEAEQNVVFRHMHALHVEEILHALDPSTALMIRSCVNGLTDSPMSSEPVL